MNLKSRARIAGATMFPAGSDALIASTFFRTFTGLSLNRKFWTGPTTLPFSTSHRPSRVESVELDRLGIHGADVEEVRHEKAAFGFVDELVDGVRPALENDAAGERKRFELVLGGPVAVDRNGLHDSLLDPRRLPRRKARGARTAETSETADAPPPPPPARRLPTRGARRGAGRTGPSAA